MAEVNYGQPCPSTAPDGAACAWSRSHKNDHRDATSNGRCWTGGIRTAPRWRCPRGGEYAPCGTCPTCLAKENTLAGPKRIQLRRTKGWRKPEGAIVVSRPSKWGNPYHIKKRPSRTPMPFPWVVMSSFKGHILGAHATKAEAAAQAVEVYELQIGPLGGYEIPVDLIVSELAGHDLACWCPLDQPCHADVLLELANGGGR